MKKLFTILMLTMTVLCQVHGQRQRAPMYFSAYAYLYVENNNSTSTKPMPEARWQHNIDYIGQNLASLGFNMIVTDGWGEDIRNSDGFRVKHHSSWNHEFSYWSQYAKTKGVKLGLYENPLWINDQIGSTSSLYNPNENATWFHWLQVDRAGSEDYVKRYIEYYKSFGVDYLRVDFLSWYEDGKDKLPSLTKLHGRPVEHYQRALGWMNKYCDANSIQLSLVMPHLYNHGANERQFAPGSMIRVNEDVADGGWYRLSEIGRGIHHEIWSQYHNTFDGMIFWSDISGFDTSKNQMILDGDFIWLSTFKNDDEKKSALSINLMGGGAIALTEYTIEDIQSSMHLLQNDEIFALNKDGFVGKPLFSNDPANEASQVWSGKMSNGDYIVAFFNRENDTRNRSLDFKWLGITGNATVRDMWAQKDLGSMSSYGVNVPPHGCVMLRIKAGASCTAQTITFNALPNKALNDPSFAVNASSSSTLPVSFSVVSGPATISGNTITLTGANGIVTIAASQLGNNAFCPASNVNQSFSISGAINHQAAMYIGGTFNNWSPGTVPMTLTNGVWTATNISISSGSQQLKFANTSDWKGADWGNASGLNGTAKLTTGGGSNISFSLSYLSKYTITFNDQTLNYTIKDQTLCTAQIISFAAISNKLSTDAAFNLSATASSTLPVTFALVSGPATLSGNKVTLTGGSGTVNIAANQSGNATYCAAAQVTQSFEVNPVNTGSIVSGGTYAIKSKLTGKAIDVAGNSTANGANIHQWDYLGNDNQKWMITDVGGNVYKIISVRSGKAFDVVGNSMDNGATIHQWDYLGNDNQKWQISKLANGSFKIISVHSGKSVDLMGGSTNNDTDIIQMDYTGANNQIWDFVLLSGNARISEDKIEYQQKDIGSNFSIYPNPIRAGDPIQLQSIKKSGQANVVIIEISGKVVQQSQIELKEDLLLRVKLKSGIYLIKVELLGHVEVFKILVN